MKGRNDQGTFPFSKGSLLLALCICSSLLFSCKRGGDMGTLQTLVAGNNPTYRGKPVSPETVKVVENLLQNYRRDIEAQVSQAEGLGILYKNLALKYLDIGDLMRAIAEKRLEEKPLLPMGSSDSVGVYHEALAVGFMEREIMGKALANFEKAMEYFPENELLFYNAGVCSATLGKSLVSGDQQEQKAARYRDAEANYRRAIELYPDYPAALYGLSVLLVFELGRPVEAVPLLVRVTELQNRDIDALFLLANAYYRTGELTKAVEQYDRIESITKLQDKIDQARSNKSRILEELYGSK